MIGLNGASGTWMSWLNWVDAPGVSLRELELDGSAALTLPVANLRDHRMSAPWRTLGLDDGAAYGFQADLRQSRAIDVVALAFPRANTFDRIDDVAFVADGDTVRHELLAANGSTVIYDSGVIPLAVDPAYGYHVHVLPAEAAGVFSWRVTLDQPSREGEGFADVWRAWCGPLFEPQVNFTWNATHGWSSDDLISQALRSPSSIIDQGEPYRSWTLSFDWLNTSEAAALEDMQRTITTGRSMLIRRPDLAPGRDVMFARVQQPAQFQEWFVDLTRFALRLVEMV